MASSGKAKTAFGAHPAFVLCLSLLAATPTIAQIPPGTSGSAVINSPSTVATIPASSQKLEGSVTLTVPDPLGTCIADLVDTAEQQNEDFAHYQEAIDHYSKVSSRVFARTTDALNYSFMFKGISPSSEGGDIILGEKNKLKSLASAKYLKQKFEDEMRLRIVSDIMQLAMALGDDNSEQSAQQLKEARTDLEQIVGAAQAERTVEMLKKMTEHETPQAKGSGPLWTVSQTEKRIRSAVQHAALVDPIVKEIEGDVHHYNKHGNATLVGHRIVRVALSAVSLSPSVIGPAAQAVLFGYLVVSGGTEQDKLLRELYLDKRLTSRAHLLSEEAHLAFENYQLASLTNNKLLMACSEQLISHMTNPETATKLLGTGELTETQPTR